MFVLPAPKDYGLGNGQRLSRGKRVTVPRPCKLQIVREAT